MSAAARRKLDGRSDIFSFGSVPYEMVTGRKAFTDEPRLAILTKIPNEHPTPPGQNAASIRPDLEKTILRCLRKDPARRFQTMADLAGARVTSSFMARPRGFGALRRLAALLVRSSKAEPTGRRTFRAATRRWSPPVATSRASI